MDIFSICIGLVLLAIAFIFLTTHKSKKIKLPPGPPGWPVVGNLLQMILSGKPFFMYIRDLLPQYGPIFTLKFGSRTMIVICNAELVREAMIEKGQVFMNRPVENPIKSVFSVNRFAVNAAQYGPVWRSLRRNMVQNGLSSSKIKEFRVVRAKAMDKFIDRLHTEAESNDGLVWVLRNARYAVFCILTSMCFGVEMDDKMVERLDNMMKTVLLTCDSKLDHYLPFLSPFFFKQQKKAMKVREEQLRLLVPLIKKRKAILDNPSIDKNEMSFSYLDTLFDLAVEGRKTAPTDAELVTLCSEFLNGGTDTTGTSIEWAIARIIENPSIQTRLYNEIKSVVGDKKVDEKDIENMPYLNAFIKELFRKHPAAYFSLTHAVSEPTKLGGYDIPTNANVDIFLPSVSEDPKLWDNPQKFDPDRFFEGREEADITGVTAVKMIPFGLGRRICPGMNMATLHVSLMVARMVQEFEWFSDPKYGNVDFSEKVEFTIVMKNPLRAMIKARV